MQIEVGFYGWQPKVFGNNRSPVVIKANVADNTTFSGLVAYLSCVYPGLEADLIDRRRLYNGLVVLLNDDLLDVASGQQLRLKTGDKVKFVLIVAGG